jgi:hypothetical protein
MEQSISLDSDNQSFQKFSDFHETRKIIIVFYKKQPIEQRLKKLLKNLGARSRRREARSVTRNLKY